MNDQKTITLTNGSVIRTLESNSNVRGNRAKMIEYIDIGLFLSNEEMDRIFGRYTVDNSDKPDIEGAVIYVSSSKHNN